MRMSEPMTLGHWMKRLRADLDLTQEALAAAVGCAVQTIRSLESGRRRPSRELAQRLAETLQVVPDEREAFLRLARTPATLPTPQIGADQAATTAARAPSAPPRQATGRLEAGTGTPGHAPLIATKLYLPRPRGELVARPRLIDRLEAAHASSLVLLAAPAGFGKTTLLAEWLSQPARTTCHVAWLTLEPSDSDLLPFLRYLIAALQSIAPAAGATTLSLLAATRAPSLETLLSLLVNDLVQLPERSILVLDDYHVIDAPVVHQALAFLLDHLPPPLQLVLASRADPPLALSRLRARGQLTELRAHDLRFTPDEAATFLREVMDLALSVEDVAALEARTEGWIAGLHLAALSLQDRSGEQRVQFIDAFTGSHRFVVDYLVDEVLARQPSHLQSFLLGTSLLERLCGPLCDAVVLVDEPETQHGNSQLLLQEMERNNLFIVPLDDERYWYRYHHLFAQVLRERLSSGARPELVARLHQRAGLWYEQQGLLPAAIEHLFAAQDWQGASRLLDQHAEAMLMRGDFLNLRRWLQLLPRDVLREQPHLLLAQAWAQFLAEPFQGDTVEKILRDAEAGLGLSQEQLAEQELEGRAGDQAPDEPRGKLAAIRASIASNQEDAPRTIALAEEALAYLPEENLFWRTIPTLDRGLAYDATGEVVAAAQAFCEAIDLCAMAGHSYAAMIATMHLARVRARAGQLHGAAELHQRALRMAAEHGWERLPMVGLPHVWLGKLLYEWNDMASATRHLLAGIRLVGPREQQRVLLEGYATLACVKQAQGDVAGALHHIERAGEVARPIAAPWAASLLRTYSARLWLAQGQLDRAGRLMESAGLQMDGVLMPQRELEHIMLARVGIARGRSGEVLPFLERLLQSAEAAGRLGSMIEILLLQALARHARGDAEGAATPLQRALLLAHPEGYLRVFVDEGAPMAALLGVEVRNWGVGNGTQRQDVRAYAHRLLTMLGGIDARTAAHLTGAEPRARTPDGETLTERELEVLRLLAAGHSNQAIAQELVLAVGTVKRHVSNLTGKLGVQSRLQAVARARELGLL